MAAHQHQETAIISHTTVFELLRLSFSQQNLWQVFILYLIHYNIYYSIL